MKDSISKRHLTMLNTSLGEEVMALFADDDIIEIMLNPGGELWAESLTKGKFNTQHGLTFAQAENIIKLVAAHQRAIASFDHPEVACELPGSGARFQAWLPPVVTSACFTIRKHVVRELSLDDYVKVAACRQKMRKRYVRLCVKRKILLLQVVRVRVKQHLPMRYYKSCRIRRIVC